MNLIEALRTVSETIKTWVEGKNYLKAPPNAELGQIISVKSVNENGEVVETETVNIPEELYILGDGETVEDAPESAKVVFDPNETGEPVGGSDISLGITGAAVGQTVKITAVNENGVPTAWEPVDMASEGEVWRLIRIITLTEDAASIEPFTTDEYGNEFSLSAVKIVSDDVKLGETSTVTSGSIRLWISKRNTANQQNTKDILPSNAYIEPAFPNTKIGLFCEIKKHGCVATIIQNTAAGALTMFERPCYENTNIERIMFTTGNYNTQFMGAGTNLYIWGIDA